MMCAPTWQFAVGILAVAAVVLVAWLDAAANTRRLKRVHGRFRAELERQLDLANERATRAESELSQAERHRDNMFSLVAQIETERDEWARMHISDSQKHAATHAVYDRELRNERIRIFHLLEEVNKRRGAEGKKPIRTPKHLDSELGIEAEPVGLVNKYVDELKDLYVKGHPDFVRERGGATRPADTDGEKERAALAEWRKEPDGAKGP